MRLALLLPILLIAAAGPVRGETVFLTDPYSSVCVVSPGAEYTVDNGALRPVRGEFSIAPHGVTPLQPRFLPPQPAEPGGVVRIYLSTPEPLDEVRAGLRDTHGRVLARAVAFPITRPGEDPLWAILAAVPADADPGAWTAEVTVVSGARTWEALVDLAVQPRQFRTERLALTGDLTTLVTAPDPKKTAESRALAILLARTDREAVYETRPLVVPLPGARRTSGFGDRRVYEYSNGTSDTSVHLGVDIASPQGTPVPAGGRGRVVFAGKRILTGNTVVVEHLPGVFSLYFHMSSIAVTVGQLVEAGAVLGAVGMTGFATGPHLHWEVTVSGEPVDPDALTRGPLLDTEPRFPDIGQETTAEGR